MNLDAILYTDGACPSKVTEIDKRGLRAGRSACGVAVFDPNGNHIVTLSRSCRRRCTVNEAELGAILSALELAASLGYRDIEIRADSRVAVAWLKSGHTNSPHIEGLLHTVVVLRETFHSVRAKWVPREQNELANLAAQSAVPLCEPH